MEYRRLPHGEEEISVIGMGSSVIGEQPESDIIETVQFALDSGVNFLIWRAVTQAFFRRMEKH